MQRTIPGGLRAIIGYKLCKAAAELLASIAIFILGSVGLAADLGYAAQAIRRHATEAWSIALAERLLDVSTAHNVFVVAMAMLADGLVTSIEGWALYRRYVWSRWLVMATTCALIPFEVIALVHHANFGRALVLLVNLAIIVYLIRRHGESA